MESPEDYTPTTVEVRGAYAVFGFEGNSYNHPDNHQSMDTWRAEFDRWLRSIQYTAWEEGFLAGDDVSTNPYGEVDQNGR